MPASTPPSATAATAWSAKSTRNMPPRRRARWRKGETPSCVVPANAGTHTPRRLASAKWPQHSLIFDLGGYGSQRAREERLAGTTGAVFFLTFFFAAVRALGRLRSAARCAADNAALAQSASSSGSSYSRSGSCQYEPTVTVLARV